MALESFNKNLGFDHTLSPLVGLNSQLLPFYFFDLLTYMCFDSDYVSGSKQLLDLVWELKQWWYIKVAYLVILL